jgi:AAA domain-containing protein
MTLANPILRTAFLLNGYSALTRSSAFDRPRKDYKKEFIATQPYGKTRPLIALSGMRSDGGATNVLPSATPIRHDFASAVRCNGGGDQGHVRIPNRCNVALSRAKERLFIVGARSMWGGVQKRWPMRKVLDEIQAGGGRGLAIVKAGAMR